jgi:hypothetical protein
MPKLTDLDADGVAEVAVAYQLGCGGDVSLDIVTPPPGQRLSLGDNGKMLGLDSGPCAKFHCLPLLG